MTVLRFVKVKLVAEVAFRTCKSQSENKMTNEQQGGNEELAAPLSFSDFVASQNTSENTESPKGQERGTDNEVTQTSTEDSNESTDNQTKSNVPNSEPGKEKAPEAGVTTKKPNRYQELANKNREVEGKYKDLESKYNDLSKRFEQVSPKKDAEPSKPKEYVPKPQEPKYPKDKLIAAKQQLEAKLSKGEATQQDLADHAWVSDEILAWSRHEHALELWEIKNGKAAQEREFEINHYKQQAVKKWPDLADSNSERFKTYQQTRTRLDEIVKNIETQGDYWAAVVSDLILTKKNHGTELGTLKAENEKLKKQIENLNGKLDPVDSDDAAESEDRKPTDKLSADEWFKQKRKEKRQYA